MVLPMNRRGEFRLVCETTAHSFGEIAEQFGMTRNAAISLARRLDVCRPPGVADSNRRDPRFKNKKRDASGRPRPHKPIDKRPAPTPPTLAVPERLGPPPSLVVHLRDLVHGDGCRWIEDEKSLMFCGAGGFPYCPFHARIVYRERY